MITNYHLTKVWAMFSSVKSFLLNQACPPMPQNPHSIPEHNSPWELDGVWTRRAPLWRGSVPRFNSPWELDGVRTAGLGALERQGTGGGIARISYFRHKLLRLSWKKTSYCAKIKDRGSPGFFAHQRPSHLTFL